ncbi:retrovirus-related pol polyprotein from transposon TNT 1-94 [Tanacetum coccineum]
MYLVWRSSGIRVGSLSGDCDMEKNGKWSCIYAVGSREYQTVCTRLDIASADVGSLKANLQHMEAFSTTEAGYMMFTEAWKKEIWLKGLLTESRYELRLVAGIATGALVKGGSRSKVSAQVEVAAYRYLQRYSVAGVVLVTTSKYLKFEERGVLFGDDGKLLKPTRSNRAKSSSEHDTGVRGVATHDVDSEASTEVASTMDKCGAEVGSFPSLSEALGNPNNSSLTAKIHDILGTNEGTSNLPSQATNSSGSSFWNVDASSPSSTPIIKKIDKIEKLIVEGKVTLVDDEGKLLEKVASSYEYDSEDEVASIDNEMANFLAKKDDYGTQRLLEQWMKSYENANCGYDPYDDDLYEGPFYLFPFLKEVVCLCNGRRCGTHPILCAYLSTGRSFTIVGNAWPLTRITITTEVPLRKPTALENETPKPVVTLIYSKKPGKSKTNVLVSKSKVLKYVSANKKEPSQSWGSIVSDVPSSSLDDCRSSKLFSEGIDLLTGSRGNNLYTLSLGDMMTSSPICLLSKASKTKSWLWHRRLSHLNFGAINHLARHDLIRGLLKLKFEKDNMFSACAMGKSKKKPYKPKSEDTNQEKLYLLHMDLCGPMRVTSVKCLRSKDEAPDFIIKFLKMIQVRLKVPVRRIRTDNGTELVNQTLREYYEKVDISYETSVARSPQQNSVVERQNCTLIEAARTMLIYAKAPLFLWAETVATACYTQNRSIVRLRHDKTPYELLHDKPPDLSFFHLFGALQKLDIYVINLMH